jgi:hypothetical protein
MITDQLIGRDMEGSDGGVIEVLFWHLLGETEVNHEYIGISSFQVVS